MICFVCRKKLSLSTAFECSCSKTVCIKHLLREDHSCTKLQNPKEVALDRIVADKVKDRI